MEKLDPLKAFNSPVNVPVPMGRTRDIFRISHAVILKVVGHH